MNKRPPPNLQALFGIDSLSSIEAKIKSVERHPATSNWLRDALRTARQRDALDALKDAEILIELLELRFNALILRHGSED